MKVTPHLVRLGCLLCWCLGFAPAQTPPSCQQLLEHLENSFSVAHSVTSTVNVRSGVVEIAYNRSRFDRQGSDVTVTLLEQRGRRTPYDQDVFLENPAQNTTTNQYADQYTDTTNTPDDNVPLPFNCAQHDLEVVTTSQQHSTHDAQPRNTVSANNISTNNISTNNIHINAQNITVRANNASQNRHPQDNYSQDTSQHFVLSLTNTQDNIPVDFWKLEFRQVGNWYLLEHLFAPFEITIMRLPVRGHFTMTFDGWDIPARLPLSPRERLN